MKFRWYVGLYFVSLLVLLGIATQEGYPGYMDADYYYASGLRIATNKTVDEPFLWNYLGEPEGIPQPAFTYWMPLAGMISALGISLTGAANLWSARLPFILLSALISPLTAYLATRFTPTRWGALLAGGLAIFSGFYLAYLPTTETFGIYMLLGAIIFLLIHRLQKDAHLSGDDPGEAKRQKQSTLPSSWWVYMAAGVGSGVMFMARTDGLIWLLLVLGAIGLQLAKSRRSNPPSIPQQSKGAWLAFLLCLAAFLGVISPWVMRNWQVFGTLFAPGSGRSLWITSYDELFAFPADQLTPDRWLQSGLGGILRDRVNALGVNAASILAVQGGIFLLPLVLLGMWKRREDWKVALGGLGWLATLIVMTIIFPLQGARGGFFHAGAGFQSLIWTMVPAGLLEFVEWGKRSRNWKTGPAASRFAGIIIGLMILVSGFLTWQRITGASGESAAWGSQESAYQQVEHYLGGWESPAEAIVMVSNPPGYYAVTGRQAIVIPNGDLLVARSAADKYGAQYLLLDHNYPDDLEEVFTRSGNYPGLLYLDTVSGIQVYEFTRGSE